MKRIAWMLLVPLVLGVGPCGTDKPTSGAIAGQGVMHQGVGPECPNTWAITTANGDVYWPVEDPAFHEEGLKVSFSVRHRPDMASICMAGTIVEVISIEKL